MKESILELIETLKNHPNHWSYNWVISELEDIIETYNFYNPNN